MSAELESIRNVLKRRDGLSNEDCDGMFQDFRDMLEGEEDPEGLVQEFFGLEPDYIMDIELGLF